MSKGRSPTAKKRGIVVFGTLGLVVIAVMVFALVRFSGEDGMIQRGEASWYGPGFHGKETASGEIFDQNEMTAASRTLPLGTRVLVTNRDNGKSVEVTINDRGPYVDGRIIDLSKAAARKLGLLKPGIADVRIDVISDGNEPE
jgi:rare lipoprotein A (peptidoglycan hydrolase)